MSWQLPVKTDWMKTQESHEPSMQYAKDIYKCALLDMNPGFTALEIGMAWGFSTLAILEAGAKSLLSVDPNVLAHGHEEAEANGYTNHVWTCCQSQVYWKENNQTFDLIYVDGSHLYDDVKLDLYESWKRLNPNGRMLIDDWDHKNNIKVDDNAKFSEYGVSLACWEFWRDHPDVKDAGIEGRVLWFQK